MKSSDRMILLIVLGVVLVGALWFGLISPKRSELSKLGDQVAETQSEVSQTEALSASALEAREDYRANYQRLIALGKAVPGDHDVAGFLDQVDSLATEAGVDFDSLKLASSGADAAPVPAPTETAPPEGTESEDGESEDAAAAAAPAPATETAAADLPLGATVGPAGLPVMPYDLTFTGTFFEIADFMAELDKLVRLNGDVVRVDGRLLTVDGFTLAPDPEAGFPTLTASLHVTTFVTPADQGVTGGADPSAPAPATATPAASTTPSPTAPTASVAPPTP